MPLDVLIGGQYGSEGKGAVLAKLLDDEPARWAATVRVGAANAGHTGYDRMGRKHVALQLPLACHLSGGSGPVGIIGAGALVSLDIMEEELGTIRETGGDPVVFVDSNAHVIQEWHREQEAEAGLEAAIGSASTIAKEGIGQAELARVARKGNNARQASQCMKDFSRLGVAVIDTVDWMYRLLQDNNRILIEGTQGFGLSLYHGQWPYVTSRDTTVGGFLSQTGLSPRWLKEVYGVFRTYPIRVHGNSGPFSPDSFETTWENVGVEPEMTTVTKRQRRVATFSRDQFIRACRVNGVSTIIITFWDYLDPGAKDIMSCGGHYFPPVDSHVSDFIEQLGSALELLPTSRLRYVSTGPKPEDVYRVEFGGRPGAKYLFIT